MRDQERWLRFPASSGAVGDIAYSPDGTRIATAGEDGTARLFDAATGEQQLVLRGHAYLVTGIAFSPDGNAARVGRAPTAWSVCGRSTSMT